MRNNSYYTNSYYFKAEYDNTSENIATIKQQNKVILQLEKVDIVCEDIKEWLKKVNECIDNQDFIQAKMALSVANSNIQKLDKLGKDVLNKKYDSYDSNVTRFFKRLKSGLLNIFSGLFKIGAFIKEKLGKYDRAVVEELKSVDLHQKADTIYKSSLNASEMYRIINKYSDYAKNQIRQLQKKLDERYKEWKDLQMLKTKAKIEMTKMKVANKIDSIIKNESTVDIKNAKEALNLYEAEYYGCMTESERDTLLDLL